MNSTLPKIIRNDWRRETGQPFATARILDHTVHPEGLDVCRLRYLEKGEFVPGQNCGHIISILKGNASAHIPSVFQQPLNMQMGSHLYIPAGVEFSLTVEPGTDLLHVESTEPSQARGKKVLFRDEQFVYACAVGNQTLRWTLTPQYLSRRIFLYHDQTLTSKSGNPVSWFRTTMFDVAGLPQNQDGEPVFKMSYNSRTEFNVCYDVKGAARVRMAFHPYSKMGQSWSSWQPLDSDCTYHLNESAGGPEEEHYFDEATQSVKFLRNKHEVFCLDGYVSLFCMFDPASTGGERHQPGEYSDYEPISQIQGTAAFETQQRELKRFDEMLDELSVAKALGKLDDCIGSPSWELYIQGRDAQRAIEANLVRELSAEGKGRERVIEKWIGNK
jgi:hypothetical protein